MPYIIVPSPEADTDARMIDRGAFGDSIGRVFVVTSETVASVLRYPVTGSKSMKSVVVTTSAMPSMPYATPSVGEPKLKLCRMFPFPLRSITVTPFCGVPAKLDRCATSR